MQGKRTVWFLGLLLAAGLPAQTSMTVPKMTQYVEPDFGFSFWYPAAWSVSTKPVADRTNQGWFPGAAIVKELNVDNPAALTDIAQPHGVILQEIVAPKGLTELGHTKSPSPVGVDQRYFYDAKKQRWMYDQLSYGPGDSPPGVVPLPIARRTMGGLPLITGAVRHGGETIVPLTPSHFLAILTMDIGGYNIHNDLAETVMAYGPQAGKTAGAANPESAEAQAGTIRREADSLLAPRH